ncbi:transcription initiation factor TFIID subunit 10, putative [Plasmodium vinckei vinckei]|uniref:Transcription initiation factor TFIID subunit 10, putative n=1 Tax=Plasmodium vinckei vinckei TaxID=54757 RepID=A0A449BX13_PLAVN|nr:transcription initiation factor TFIID subunit 10, putative [Plasmodium vinckei vinckei]KEG03684.1 hypothetical protein YYE_01708 [Plasmodium vinckei vinckei]VEV57978.1 transcription initiation factor TFIID subunit 10, putative [Plasmodium vinckei vinckei]
MDKNFVNDDDEQLIKTLLQNTPAFGEELIDFYLAHNGCKVTEKSCFRLISLFLHKSMENIINNSMSVDSNEGRNDSDKENRHSKKELDYDKLIKEIKKFNDNSNKDENAKNLSVFLE